MSEMIKLVTLTGADDSVMPDDLMELRSNFPFVEFGILLSRDKKGHPRYPSSRWLEKMLEFKKNHDLRLAGHICGSWAESLYGGSPDFFEELDGVQSMFSRLQINFGDKSFHLDAKRLIDILRQYGEKRHVIFQLGAGNQWEFQLLRKNQTEIVILPLYDMSGGTGVLPRIWPPQVNGFTGYAGGLAPHNLHAELEKIEQVADGPIWIDVETGVRSQDKSRFDIRKAWQFLSIATEWTIGNEDRFMH